MFWSICRRKEKWKFHFKVCSSNSLPPTQVVYSHDLLLMLQYTSSISFYLRHHVWDHQISQWRDIVYFYKASDCLVWYQLQLQFGLFYRTQCCSSKCINSNKISNHCHREQWQERFPCQVKTFSSRCKCSKYCLFIAYLFVMFTFVRILCLDIIIKKSNRSNHRSGLKPDAFILDE